MKARLVLSILTLAYALSAGPAAAQSLRPATVAAWDAYVHRMEPSMATDWKATASERASMKTGQVYIRHVTTPAIDGGLLHHWTGGIFLPGVKIKPLQDWMQDYDAHSKYFTDIERSKLLSREGDTFKIYYRFRRKKIITVYYNTEHTVVYHTIDATHAASRSVATRIAEIDSPGPKERESPLGEDSGFLWRLNSYWRFLETPDGVFLECESLSLSRSIPTGLAWLIKGYVESVPRESLENTMMSIRRGFNQSGESR